MPVYLHDIPLEEAQARFNQALGAAGLGSILGSEILPLDEVALGRTLAEAVWAKLSSPHYHAAAMDGFAVRARETEGALETAPVMLAVKGGARYVDTGDPLPEGFNAVIPIENVEPLDESGKSAEDPRSPAEIRIRGAVAPWQHVRPMGEDMVATQLVLPAGQVLRPVDLGAIAGSGHTEVVVARKPRVAILPTGTELVEIGKPVETGEIIEYNSVVLAAQVSGWGGEATRYPITADDFPSLEKRVKEAVEDHDLVLVNAGSSAGSEDFTAGVVEKLGDLLVHGVAVRPGHPVILGMVRRAKSGMVPVIGVPGYPVSSALTGEIFVEPLLARWLGRPPEEPDVVTAELTRKVTSPAGDDDFMRVALGRVGGRLLAAPLTRGAGVISSLVRADGLALLPRGSQGEPAGAKVNVRLYRKRAKIDRTIFAIGSHDMTLDLLAQFLGAYGRRVASANVGSLGGLVALRRGEAHMAGAHLLDPESGEYNLTYIKDYLPDTPVWVIGLVGREQGLMVRKGNPKGIKSLETLGRKDVRFVNRQRGAGTRILLDYHLELAGVANDTIQGYDEEEYTHLAVAAAVASGRADCGLGIAAAAAALDLAFIPLFEERYDLIVPEDVYGSELMAPVWTVLARSDFREAIEGLPGYDTVRLGKQVDR